ncbi:hypothetical protein AAVH_26661 [Aphelenchoides avenae]|nr:hypothetical protein AAVH_26661 [Aphelenchus avenae]
MLPNDPLLQVLHFADYKTLVITKFSGASFLRVATKFAAELACRRRFQVSIGSYITYTDLTTGVQHMIMCRADDPTSLAGACRELAEVIGPHAVANLTFGLHTWNVPGIDAIFEAAPPLKYAEDVELRSPPGSTVKVNTEAFMHNFSGMKSLRLKCNYDVFRQYSWAFLREESARELLRVGVGAEHEPGSMNENPAAEELVRYCTTLRRQEEALELDFSESKPFRSAFGRRVIEVSTRYLEAGAAQL